MKIRTAQSSDTEAIAQLFTVSVHSIAANSYNPEQLAAWAPASPNIGEWDDRLSNLTTLVAEAGNQLAGFLSFTNEGYIDFLYTSPTFSRQGVASQLFDQAQKQLLAAGISQLSTDASVEAKPFFETQGFTVLEEQLVERHGRVFRRFVMSKG